MRLFKFAFLAALALSSQMASADTIISARNSLGGLAFCGGQAALSADGQRVNFSGLQRGCSHVYVNGHQLQDMMFNNAGFHKTVALPAFPEVRIRVSNGRFGDNVIVERGNLRRKDNIYLYTNGTRTSSMPFCGGSVTLEGRGSNSYLSLAGNHCPLYRVVSVNGQREFVTWQLVGRNSLVNLPANIWSNISTEGVTVELKTQAAPGRPALKEYIHLTISP